MPGRWYCGGGGNGLHGLDAGFVLKATAVRVW